MSALEAKLSFKKMCCVGINYGRVPRCVESRKVTITWWKYPRFTRGILGASFILSVCLV